MPLSEKILLFLKDLDLNVALPKGVEVMNPFKNGNTFNLCKKFYKKYYNDNNARYLILGINPGRFGGGVTGIPFTDPIRLQDSCDILNDFQKRQELSSVFIYEMIRNYGGPAMFYNKFYISAISPLGFVKNNKNLNYYDDRLLENAIRNFVAECMNRQMKFGISRDVVFCLGEGKNFAYLSKLNKELKLFKTIIPLAHPRFIMQYRLKRKDEYIEQYLHELRVAKNN